MTWAGLVQTADKIGLTVTMRIRPLDNGFVVLIQAAMYDGAKPKWERHYPPETDRLAAIDDVAATALAFGDSSKRRMG